MAIEFNCTGDYQVVEVRDYQIESGNYRMHTGYNNRNGWYVSLYTTDDELILGSLGIISEDGQNLTWRYSRNIFGLPDGDLWVFNKTGDSSKALTKDNFGEGKDWGLFYLTQSEMDELGINKR